MTDNIINVKGEIVSDETAQFYDFFDMTNYTSPNKIKQALADANGSDVTVEISSPGGDTTAASDIYTALKQYDGNVNVNITGLAASAASVIAMAGSSIKIAPTAQIMIHEAWATVEGNQDNMQQAQQMLSAVDQGIVNAYAAKTGMPENQLLKMMADETWLSAQDAVKYGFADEIMFDHDKKLANNAVGTTISATTLNKFHNIIAKLKIFDDNKKTVKDNDEPSLLQQKINILKGEEND